MLASDRELFLAGLCWAGGAPWSRDGDSQVLVAGGGGRAMEVIVAQRAVAAHGSAVPVTQPLSPPHSDHSSEPGQETDHHKVESNLINSCQLLCNIKSYMIS